MKFCKDCQFYRPHFDYAGCHRFDPPSRVNPVFGGPELTDGRYCYAMRKPMRWYRPNACGPDARWFEPKEKSA